MPYHLVMLHIAAYMLNIVLIATGVFQYLKLDFCWAGLGVGVGLVNLVVLYFNWTKGVLAIVAALASVAAITQGIILGINAAKTFSDRGMSVTNTSMWDLIFSGHDFSYAIAYVGAGLLMLVILVREKGNG